MSLRIRNHRWHYRFQLNGQTYTANTGLAATQRNEAKARQMEADARRTILTGDEWQLRLRPKRFDLCMAEYLAYREREDEKPSTTRRVCTSAASLLVFFSTSNIQHIQARQINAYKQWRTENHQVAAVTLRHDLHALNGFFRWAIAQQYCSRNPMQQVSIPSDGDARRDRVLSADEEEKYFAEAAKNPDLWDAARLILLTGMRPEEVFSLTCSDYDATRQTVRIRQGKSRAAKRLLPLRAEASAILARRTHKARSQWVFPGRGTERPIRKLTNGHVSACRRAGVDFLLYDLRHTFATRAAAAGTPIPTLAKLLGHASLRTVERYVHPDIEAMQAALRKLDERES